MRPLRQGEAVVNENVWNTLTAEQRRVALRRYCSLLLSDVEEYILHPWSSLPLWVREDLEG